MTRPSYHVVPPLPFHWLAVLAVAFALPGLVGHDPWKSADAIGIEIAHQMHLTGDWLVPRLAGEPWLDHPPLYHWISVLTARAGQFLLPFHDAARIASALCVLAACALLYRAGQQSARGLGAEPHEVQRNPAGILGTAATVTLIGSIGLMVHAHEAVPELASLAAGAAFLALLPFDTNRPPSRTVTGLIAGAAGCGLSLGAAFLATGPMVPVALSLSLVAALALCPGWRTRQHALFLAIALSVAVACALAWLLALRARSPELLSITWELFTRARGDLWENFHYVLGVSAWFLWPAWPLALWGLWSCRHRMLAPALLVPFVASLLLLIGLCLQGVRQDVALLVQLPPVALLASHGVPALRRSAAALLDWFGVMCFTFFAGLVWLGYLAMMSGWPPRVANNFAKTAPGFLPQFEWLPFSVALLLAFAWGLFALRMAPSPARGATRWAAGVVLLWGTFATLWLPWADYQKSYRPVALQLRSKLPPGESCVAGINLGAPQRAALSYHADLRTRTDDDARCRFLIVQGGPGVEARPEGRWAKLADVGRPGDKSERFRLYRRER